MALRKTQNTSIRDFL